MKTNGRYTYLSGEGYKEVYSPDNPAPTMIYWNNVCFNSVGGSNTMSAAILFPSTEPINAGGWTPMQVLTWLKSKIDSSNDRVWFPFFTNGYDGMSAAKSKWFRGYIGISSSDASWSSTQLSGAITDTQNGTLSNYDGTYANSGLSDLNNVRNYSTSILM